MSPYSIHEQAVADLFGRSASGQHQRTRNDEKLLDAALQLMVTQGLARVTVDDIAARAETSRMMIFRRFGSKDALLAEAFERELRVQLDDLANRVAPVDTTRECADVIFSWVLDLVWTHPYIARIAKDEPQELIELWRGRDRAWAVAGIDLFVAFLTSPTLRDRPEYGRARNIAELLERFGASYALMPSIDLPQGDAAAARRLVRGGVDAILS